MMKNIVRRALSVLIVLTLVFTTAMVFDPADVFDLGMTASAFLVNDAGPFSGSCGGSGYTEVKQYTIPPRFYSGETYTATFQAYGSGTMRYTFTEPVVICRWTDPIPVRGYPTPAFPTRRAPTAATDAPRSRCKVRGKRTRSRSHSAARATAVKKNTFFSARRRTVLSIYSKSSLRTSHVLLRMILCTPAPARGVRIRISRHGRSARRSTAAMRTVWNSTPRAPVS